MSVVHHETYSHFMKNRNNEEDNIFCFILDQKRSRYLMRINQISQLLSDKFKKKIQIGVISEIKLIKILFIENPIKEVF